MFVRISTTGIWAIVCLCGVSSALAAPGDDLIGDWERSVGATRTRELWHIERQGKRITIRGEYVQGDKEVGKFRGDDVKLDEASGALSFKVTVTMAGEPAVRREHDYEAELKGQRLAVTATLKNKKDTVNLTKAKSATKPTDDKPPATVATTTKPSTDKPTPPANRPDDKPAGQDAEQFKAPDGLPAFTEVMRVKYREAYGLMVGLSPDGRWLATCANNAGGKGVDLYDVEAKKLHSTLSTGGLVSWVGFTRDGRLLAAEVFQLGKPSFVVAFSTADWSEAWRIEHEGAASAVAFDSEGKHLALASDGVPGGPEGYLKVIEVATKKEVYTQGKAGVDELHLSSDGRLLVFDHNANPILQWATGKKMPPRKLGGTSVEHGERDMCSALSPDDRLFACGDNYGATFVHNVATGKLVRAIPRFETQAYMSGVRFLDSQRLLVSHSACELVLFNLSNGKPLAYVKAQHESKHRAHCLAAQPGGTRCAVFYDGEPREIIVWQLPPL